jgi:hypothetical protein
MRGKVILFLLVCIVFAEGVWAREVPIQDVFVKNMMSIIPRPKDKEFAEYQTCINAFFESVNNNDFNAALKCFPINEQFQALDVKGYAELGGAYIVLPDAPLPPILPSDNIGNYMSIFDMCVFYWRSVYIDAFMLSNPEFMGTSIDSLSDDFDKKIITVQNMKNSKKYSMSKILEEITLYSDALIPLDKAMNVTEAKYLATQVRIDNKYQEFDIIVIKIHNNWFIKYIGHTDNSLPW